jgi:hypothetical protein
MLFLAVVPVIQESAAILPAIVGAALAIGAGCVGLGALALRRPIVRETTLIPAWSWALAAVIAWSAIELAAGLSGDPPSTWQDPLRLAAVTLSFCPILAVLGAKRPQHAAWSFVVAAFWGIVMLPAAEAFFLQRGQRLEMGDARSWFLWILIAVGPINYLPTRQWLAATLLAAGQMLALSEYLPLVHRALFAQQHLAGLCLGCLSLALARSPRSLAAGKYDRLWLDFRDTFGLFWSLRLQERVNAVAQTNGWPIWLSWSGFLSVPTVPVGQGLPDDVNSEASPTGTVGPLSIEPTLRTSLKGLLRRFVSGRWIAERLGRDID